MSNYNYPETELYGALKRAFIDGGADFIVIDSNPRGQRFLYESIQYGLDHDLIYQDQAQDEGQTVTARFRPTKRMFGEIDVTPPKKKLDHKQP